jgi:hypothetical protein
MPLCCLRVCCRRSITVRRALLRFSNWRAYSRELLDRDRDIRNLIGARSFYIAEFYDVGQSGDTQKPFGRVFYTKGKSLIFYGYDLDQQPGIKKTGVFQAWGGRGADRQHAVSLGLLHMDDAIRKRWVLKSNDAKTISQIVTWKGCSDRNQSCGCRCGIHPHSYRFPDPPYRAVDYCHPPPRAL